MSVSPRFALVIPLAAAALLFMPDYDHGGKQTRTLAAEGKAVEFDVFGIASSRTMFLPAPPAGKVTVQFLATAAIRVPVQRSRRRAAMPSTTA